MSTPSWEVVGAIAAWENLPFAHVGPLVPRVGRSGFPITGGTFAVTAVAARVGTAATGAPIVLDVNKNGVSIYPTTGAQPTILADATLADAGAHTATTVTDGDYLSIDIDQVGAGVPGADLVVNVRLQRIP